MLYTIKQVAEQLQLDYETIRRWINKGELPALKLGSGDYRIDEADLKAFLDKARQSPA